jgi:mono/diheme cytochrome c family protein
MQLASPSPSPVETVSEERSPEELVEAGRSVYNANCIACHGIDPTRDGALGPAVAGSSLELLEARVLRAEYPPGYEPKRPSRVMVALPHLEPKLPELAAYLQSL